MGKAKAREPRTFFLNESHELGRGVKGGGGRQSLYAPIDWARKGTALNHSLAVTIQAAEKSRDPLKEKRLFFVVNPEEKVEKVTKAKSHPTGIIEEETDYSGQHASVFRRLGLDLIEVTGDGDAIVHATREKVASLAGRAMKLDDLGSREQSRWATIRGFETISPSLRVDNYWLGKNRSGDILDTIIEFHPVLSRIEVDIVLRSIADMITASDLESLVTNGKDFSGRHWLRANLSKKNVQRIAREYDCVQSLHDPIYAVSASKPGTTRAKNSVVRAGTGGVNPAFLPTVALFDDGVPAEHQFLSPFRRGEYLAPATGVTRSGEHGSKVASRLVFGEQDFRNGLDGLDGLVGDCQFVDVNVAGAGRTIHEKSVPEAMDAIARVFRDVRVYNFSFSSPAPISETETVKRREQLLMTQDIDNFIFENDVIVAVCSGNSQAGIVPIASYPRHIDDPNWQIGHWASGFNTLVTGAYVDCLNPDAIVRGVGWPSPFTRIGPGLTGAPVPNLSAAGGNRGLDHRYHPGLGVTVCNEFGIWEDASGTSFAVPISAREAAFTLKILEEYCDGDVRPFGVTAKAFLALTAKPIAQNIPVDVAQLSSRTLGRGTATSKPLRTPDPGSAVFLWQGILEGPNDKIQVQFPIPLGWLNAASSPKMRLIASADVPVNEAVKGVWGCRKINCKLRSAPESKAFFSKRGLPFSHSTYPLIEKVFDLSRPPSGVTITDDIWIIELTYDEIGEYPVGMQFSPQQRIAFAAELFDDSDSRLSPQAFVQDLPLSASMNHLSISSDIKVPVIVHR